MNLTNLSLRHPLVALDIESEGLEAAFDTSCKITYIGFAYETQERQLRSSGVTKLDTAKNIIETLINMGVTFIVHNNTFDISVIKTHLDIDIENYHDTMLMSYCWQPSSTNNHSLATLAPLVDDKKYLKPNFKEVSKQLALYCQQDCRITYKLFWYFYELFKTDKRAWNHYIDVALPYTKIIRQLSLGAYLDVPVLKEFREGITKREQESLCKLQSQVGYKPGKVHQYKKEDYSGWKSVPIIRYRVLNGEIEYERCDLDWFNPNSPTQIAQVLMKKGWKPTKLGKPNKIFPNGQPSTSKDVLELINLDIAQDLLEYGALSHLKTNFLDPLYEHQKEGYIRVSFNQCMTRTRRLSSSNPTNLQNIPAKGEGAELRKMFVAPPGYKIVCGDLDRIEIVVLAFYLELICGDTYLSSLVRKGVDVHDRNTEKWFNLDKKTADPDIFNKYRKIAKNVVFALIYGAGKTKLAAMTRLSEKEVSELMDNIIQTTAIMDLKNYVSEECRRNKGVIHSWFGGRFFIPEILFKEHSSKAAGFRRANNYLIQGTAGDIFVSLQLDLVDRLYDTDIDYRTALVVHDEAVYIVEESKVDQFVQLANETFCNNTILSTEEFFVPVSATFHSAENWHEAKK